AQLVVHEDALDGIARTASDRVVGDHQVVDGGGGAAGPELDGVVVGRLDLVEVGEGVAADRHPAGAATTHAVHGDVMELAVGDGDVGAVLVADARREVVDVGVVHRHVVAA